jgi:uncharacterized protein YbbC (DUF1343 family)
MPYFNFSRLIVFVLGCVLALPLTLEAQEEVLPKVKLGVEVLADRGYKPILGKKIGLLTHAAGVNSQGEATYTVFAQDPRIALKALFSPEHGLFSKAEASQSIDHSHYQGIPVYSLHGKHRKPTADMLKGIDIMVVDLQDIGVRSYTYISCLKLCMEACFEQGVEVMILDRPNPLGGLKVDGPIMEKKYMGYLGAFPIPYVYGLTIGELAHMTAKEPKWLNCTQDLKKPKKLTIIPMSGWRRSMLWKDTGLTWTATSPYIQDLCSVLGYASTGLGCQIGGFTHGIGSPYPFRFLSHPKSTPESLAQKLQALPLKGLSFKPIKTQSLQGKALTGVYIYLSDWKALKPTLLSFYLMPLACELKGMNVFAKASAKDKEMFNKHVGSSLLWESLVKYGKNTDIARLAKDWDRQNQKFQEHSRKYYIYP